MEVEPEEEVEGQEVTDPQLKVTGVAVTPKQQVSWVLRLVGMNIWFCWMLTVSNIYTCNHLLIFFKRVAQYFNR